MIYLISISVALSSLGGIAVSFLIFMKIRELKYLKQIISYGDGLADIHARMKEMALEHHTLVEQMVLDSTADIIRHVTYTNRWQKVMAKMIRVAGTAPLAMATGSETVKESEALHEIGLDIAKVAFDDKQTLDVPVVESSKAEPPTVVDASKVSYQDKYADDKNKPEAD